eukprot:1880667-Prymnesium_polylepis.1
MHLIIHKDDLKTPHKHGYNRFARLRSTDPKVKRRVGDALSYYEFLSADAAPTAEEPAAEAAPAADAATEAARVAEAATEAARVAEAATEAARKASINALVAALVNGKTKQGLRAVGHMIEKKCKVSVMKNTSTLNHAHLRARVVKAAIAQYPRWCETA